VRSYVLSALPDGAAKEAGIREGDVIVSVNDTRVNSSAELQEAVSRYRPGQEVSVIIRRDGKAKQFDVVLRNLEGSTELVKKDDVLEILGASFEPLSEREKQSLGIDNGIRVKSVKEGKFQKIGVEEGFILTRVNKKPVSSVNDITTILKESEGGIIIEGMDRKGKRSYYAFGM